MLRAICLIFFPILLSADLLTLKSGLELEGNLLAVTNGQVTFRNDELGKLVFPLSHLEILATDESLDLYIKGGERLCGPLLISCESVILGEEEYPFECVVSVQTLDWPYRFRWSGRVGVDLGRRYGNTDSEDVKIFIETHKPFDECRSLDILGRFNYGKKEGETSAFKVTFQGKYIHLFSKHWSWFYEQKLTHDELGSLDLRAEERLGLLYHLIVDPKLLLSLRAGFGRLDSWYTSKHGGNWSYLGGYDFSWTFWRNWTYEQHLLYTGSVQELHRYRAEAVNRLRCPLSAHWDISVWYEWDYDRSPPAGTKNSDHLLSLQLGFSW